MKPTTTDVHEIRHRCAHCKRGLATNWAYCPQCGTQIDWEEVVMDDNAE